MTMGELTMTTCAANCWLAKEDVCRCMCAGSNHGVLLKDGAERPVRSRRIRGRMFELTAMHDSWLDAQKDCSATSRAFNEEHNLQWFMENAVMNHATKAQLKWEEVKNFLAQDGNDDAYLVWRKIW